MSYCPCDPHIGPSLHTIFLTLKFVEDKGKLRTYTLHDIQHRSRDAQLMVIWAKIKRVTEQLLSSGH